MRVETRPIDTIRNDLNNPYVYTEDSRSIEELLTEEGLALVWSQDGQHLGWFIYLDSVAKKQGSGCLWHDYQWFQRGEPNDFRVPGPTYLEFRS